MTAAPTQYDTLILAVSTLQRLAFGMRPFWSTEPGAIRLTLMEQGCTRFARTFFSIVRGRPSRNAIPASGYNSHNASRIRLEMARQNQSRRRTARSGRSGGYQRQRAPGVLAIVSSYPPVAGPDAASDPTLAALLAQLNARFHGAICCTLVYGSCLRSGDIYDGLLDLYLICDSYRAAYRRPLLAAANWLLPPNVFYAEQPPAGRHGRGQDTAQQGHGDFVARLPARLLPGLVRVLYLGSLRTADAHPVRPRRAVAGAGRSGPHRGRAHAAANALPALPPEGSLSTLWEQALALSYATELRTERSGRAQELVQSSMDFYTALTHQHAAHLGFPLALYEQDGAWRYRSRTGGFRRHTATLAWALRRGQGKLLSVLRLVKALFTFDGGLDYIAWKLERHSGEAILIPDKVRRAPLIHLWGFFWGLYRRGIFK